MAPLHQRKAPVISKDRGGGVERAKEKFTHRLLRASDPAQLRSRSSNNARSRPLRVSEAARPSIQVVCGRPGESDIKPESWDKVRVYVNASGEANEIISGVRERLREMNGTEVVYSSAEADLTVNIVALHTQ